MACFSMFLHTFAYMRSKKPFVSKRKAERKALEKEQKAVDELKRKK